MSADIKMMNGSNATYYVPAFSASSPGRLGRCRVMAKTVKTLTDDGVAKVWKRQVPNGETMTREYGGCSDTYTFVLDSDKANKPAEFFTPISKEKVEMNKDNDNYHDRKFLEPEQVNDWVKKHLRGVEPVVGTHPIYREANPICPHYTDGRKDLDVIIHEATPWHIRYSIQHYRLFGDDHGQPSSLSHYNIFMTPGTLDKLTVRFSNGKVLWIDDGWTWRKHYHYDDPFHVHHPLPGRWRPLAVPEGLEL
jgi:hypothetical protein